MNLTKFSLIQTKQQFKADRTNGIHPAATSRQDSVNDNYVTSEKLITLLSSSSCINRLLLSRMSSNVRNYNNIHVLNCSNVSHISYTAHSQCD